MRVRTHDRRDRRGATAVEFAMTFPVIAILLLVAIEYGFYFSQLAMVQNATGDAVRHAMNRSNAAQAEATAEDTAETLLDDIGFDCTSLACTISATGSVVSGQNQIELAVEVPYEQLTGILPSGALGAAIQLPSVLPARAAGFVVGP